MSVTPNRVGGGAAPVDELAGVLTASAPADETPADDTLTDDVSIERPGVDDGAALWRIARDSGSLDLNSSYAYLLWCRDFADTSVVARRRGAVVGFISGYLRPAAPRTVVVWQVAVDSSCRGKGVAARMLDGLVNRLAPMGVRYLETTVTADNTASNRLFSSFAARHGADMDRAELFGRADFPDGHDPEFLYRIGPL